LEPSKGLTGELTIEADRGRVAIHPPTGWLTEINESKDGYLTLRFVGPETECQAQEIEFLSSRISKMGHTRIPPIKPQQFATDVLVSDLSEIGETLQAIKDYYDKDNPLGSYGEFLKDCRYILEFEPYVRLMNIIVRTDKRFKPIADAHNEWFANMLLDKKAKYPIQSEDTFDERLNIYSQYSGLPDLGRDEVADAYFAKLSNQEDPATTPEELDFLETNE
jgi:hypothetical protein